MQVRVRFAPSPTGHLHIGGLRVAIFNWLFARHNNGKFLLRIEDTDIERSKKEYTDSILESLKWMDIIADEPVVIQTKMIGEHKKLIDKLLAQKKAYICTCPRRSTEQLESEESYSKYDGTCRNKEITIDQLQSDTAYVIRFKLPSNIETVSFNDMIIGPISTSIDQLDDFVIARSDGTPIYQFAVVADDIMMKISHVIRGADHINNTPKQILIYQALEAEIPNFAHLPLITNAQGAKLSKRDAAVSVLEYRKSGFLSDALFNYLVRLGWSHGDQEIFTKDELIKYFTLDHVGKSPAVFDMQKLEWVNTVYIKQKSAKEILQLIICDIDEKFREKVLNLNDNQIIQLIDLYKERVKTLKSMADEIIALDNIPGKYEESGLSDLNIETKNYLKKLVDEFKKSSEWNEDGLSVLIKQFCKQLQIKLPAVAQPIRLALTGTMTSPGIFHLLSIFGKEESIKRINIFINFIDKYKK